MPEVTVMHSSSTPVHTRKHTGPRKREIGLDGELENPPWIVARSRALSGF